MWRDVPWVANLLLAIGALLSVYQLYRIVVPAQPNPVPAAAVAASAQQEERNPLCRFVILPDYISGRGADAIRTLSLDGTRLVMAGTDVNTPILIVAKRFDPGKIVLRESEGASAFIKRTVGPPRTVAYSRPVIIPVVDTKPHDMGVEFSTNEFYQHEFKDVSKTAAVRVIVAIASNEGRRLAAKLGLTVPECASAADGVTWVTEDGPIPYGDTDVKPSNASLK